MENLNVDCWVLNVDFFFTQVWTPPEDQRTVEDSELLQIAQPSMTKNLPCQLICYLCKAHLAKLRVIEKLFTFRRMKTRAMSNVYNNKPYDQNDSKNGSGDSDYIFVFVKQGENSHVTQRGVQVVGVDKF